MTATMELQALETLLFAAFEGEPGAGSRELRLSDGEARSLRDACPAVCLTQLDPRDEDEKSWYDVRFA